MCSALVASCTGGDRPPGIDSGGVTPSEDNSPDSGESPSDPSAGSETPGSSNDEDPGDDESSDDDVSGGAKFDLGKLPDFEVNGIGCNIDFLFVVDNSISMRDTQESLAASVPDFIQTMTEEIDDLEALHIGVVSTDDAILNGPNVGEYCSQIGGLVTRTMDIESNPISRTCVPYANGKNFMTRDDDLNDKFTCAAVLGASGSGNERPMDALRAAFSPEMTAPGACNEGFFREDAILVVVIITDEEDDDEGDGEGKFSGSAGDPQDWYDAVMRFKGDRPEYAVVLSLIGTPEPNKCEVTFEPGQNEDEKEKVSAEHSPRLIEFTERFGERGVVGDVCASNYDSFFETALGVIDLACNDLPAG